MKKPNLTLLAGRNALGVYVYIILVGLLISNGEKLFGPVAQPWLGIIAFLSLFVFSALVTGLLVLGQPAAWYFRGDHKEGIRLLLQTVAWLFLLTALSLLTVALCGWK